MHATAFKTKLVRNGDDLFAVLGEALSASLPERSIITLASKIPATCEGRFVPKTAGTRQEKHELVKKEADYYLPSTLSKYDIMLTIKQNWMFANAGIDESNADDQYVLWPKDPQATANEVWQWLRQTYGLKEVGVIITDSRSMPLSLGVVGHGISYAGFEPLYSYVGKPDLYGRPMQMEQVSVVQTIASMSSLMMGEGAEQTPLAVFSELPDLVVFTDHTPTSEEATLQHIPLEDDIYAPLLTSVDWQKGGSGK